jgi:hypothetical protein
MPSKTAMHPGLPALPGRIKLVRIAFVAQVCNLLYRRIVSCGASSSMAGVGESHSMQVTNLRYSRLKICATIELDAALGAPRAPQGWCIKHAWIVLVAQVCNRCVTCDTVKKKLDLGLVYAHLTSTSLV